MVCRVLNLTLFRCMARLVRTGALAVWLAASGCDSPAEEAELTALEPPLCTSVKQFGNGASCEAASGLDAKLGVCGTAARRTCASGWLCFDAPEFADCRCSGPSDCEARTAYINAGRTSAGKAPLASKCDGGRCAGAP